MYTISTKIITTNNFWKSSIFPRAGPAKYHRQWGFNNRKALFFSSQF